MIYKIHPLAPSSYFQRRFGWGMLFLAAAFMAVLCGTVNADTPLVQQGATWKYLDNGTNQGTNWRAPSFNDATWKSGAAELGYGDGDEVTVVSFGGKTTNKYITTYFRRAFNVEDPAVLESLNLSMKRDDGAVVYLNGVEVLRSNMPTGTVSYTTRASSALEGANELVSAIISPAALVTGINIIAVEIHQESPTSSDIGFNLSLDGVIGTPSTVVLPAGSSWKYLDNGSEQGAQWRAVNFDDSAWVSGPAELGYGDGGESTVVNSGPSTGKFVTTYFRRDFNIGDPSAYRALKMRLLRDDGAVVYLNGTEVHRTNLPSGPITSTTFAQTAIGGTDESTFNQTVLPNLLVAGRNVVAVEIHQNDATSTDISFDLELLGLTEAPAVSITRGPYLQNATSTSMVIRWRTEVAVSSKVWIGTSPTTLAETEEITEPTTEHEIEVTGLSPDTQYYYAVGSGTGQIASGSEYTFFTPPSPGTKQPFRIWVLGDSGTANANAAAVRNAYQTFTGSRYTDMWLMLGDNAYTNGTDAEFQTAVFNMYPAFLRQSPMWSTVGNHEFNTAQAIPYFDAHTFPTQGEAGGVPSGTEKYYSFDYGNVHFICLDSMSSDRSPTGPMATWLKVDLESTTQDWIIAFFHHPPYTKGSHNSDNPTGSDSELLEMRRNIVPLLEAGGVDLVLSGHSHSYERSYLIDGHYGLSTTFNDSMKKAVGAGREVDGVGGYSKPVGLASNQGSVYAVAGSSGKATNWWGGSTNLVNPDPHPAMVVSLLRMGSMVLDVDGGRLDVKFLSSTGVVDDQFTIKKELASSPPTITITSPAQDETVNAPVRITASASPGPGNEGGKVSQVDFYADGAVIGSVTQPTTSGASSFEYTWSGASAGSHTLTATVWDDRGVSTTSAPVRMNVNAPPVVLITTPQQNASYEASDSIIIAASASDSNGGVVQQISFYANGSLIATDVEAPFAVTWNDMAVGTYQLTAIAQDDLGASSTSAAVTIVITEPNVPPTVSLTSPAQNATFAANQTIALSADAADQGGISRVEFYANGLQVGSDDAAPYTWSWSNVSPGQYQITAAAIDDREMRTTSAAVSIVVNENVLPTVSLVSPAADSVYTAPATILMAATASDADAGVARVEFFATPAVGGAFKLGAGTRDPQSGLWKFTWGSASQGKYALSAVVTDVQGGSSSSGASVVITVNPPANSAPQVSISSPVQNATFIAPASFAVTAAATDDGGAISVAFYSTAAGSGQPVLLGTDTTAPYSASASNVQPGTYSLTAVATDDQGVATTSAPVTVNVTMQTNPVPAAPSGLVANASKNRVDLSWVDNAMNENGYVIERRADTETIWRTIGTVGVNVQVFKDTDFARRTLYHYRVSAFNGAGSSASPIVSVTTMR